MKKILFTSTALAAMAFGGVASAQGISLFGDARLGLGYNIFNNGDLRLDPAEGSLDAAGNVVLDHGFETPDDIRAISRVRFGVNMSGVTDSGITFGATIRADNAGGGQGGSNGQTAGNVFVSGDWGTLTFGDTAGADEFFIGDLNEVGLTCLTCQNETPFISNGGSFGRDDGPTGIADPAARPTVRYNIDVAGFGIALSANRDLNDVQVGLGYNGEWGDSSFSIGVGYNDFSEFNNFVPSSVILTPPTLNLVPGGTQWSGAIGGDFGGMFNAKVIYTAMEFDGGSEIDWAGIGLGASWDEWKFDGYYTQIVDAKGDAPFLATWDGLQAFGVGVTYDLGGGARVEGGVASVYNLSRGFTGPNGDFVSLADDGYIVADFGIGMSF